MNVLAGKFVYYVHAGEPLPRLRVHGDWLVSEPQLTSISHYFSKVSAGVTGAFVRPRSAYQCDPNLHVCAPTM